MDIKPIKRNKALQGVSREHHHGLLLCWKIRTGFSKGIPEERIKKYVDWFYTTHLIPHFELEENYMFPILGNDDELVKKALAQHKRLHRLFAGTDTLSRSLSLIEEELEQHIRFEERILFNEIQKSATEEQLEIISKIHKDEKFNDNTDDTFWIRKRCQPVLKVVQRTFDRIQKATNGLCRNRHHRPKLFGFGSRNALVDA